MSEAEKKRKELATLALLRSLMRDFPQGDVASGEEPDFIVTLNDGRKVGIELTELHREVPTGSVVPQSQEALKHRTVKRAQEIYAAKGGPFLDVSVLFGNIEFSKASVQPLAQKIAEIVAAITPAVGEVRYAEPDYGNENDFPEEIHHVRAFNLPGAERSFFSSPGATWVTSLQKENIERVLSAKDKRCESYRSRADELWLVISCNGGYMSTWFEKTSQVRGDTFQTKFDRVLLLSHFENRVIEVRTHGSAGA
jgi:hypothetical protein